MHSRRVFILLVMGIFAGCKTNHPASLTTHINPMIGTGGHGHTFPGASVPFGMVKLGPDTYNDGWDWCSGYHYSDSSIMGFSHTHLSGTGRGELLDVLFMPTVGQVQFKPGTRKNPDEGYRSRFSHKNEIARAGYYSVMLDDYRVRAELTATVRAGFHRYTFEKEGQANLIIDLGHSYKTDSILNGHVLVVNDTLVVGMHRSKGWGAGEEKYWVDHEVFFAARFSKPIKKTIFYNDGNITERGFDAQGKVVKTNLVFDINAGEQLLVKVGISGVDIKGAITNVDTEIPGWSFDQITSKANESWEQLLATIKINDPDEVHKEIFYTALYHTCLAPYTYSDCDGRYKGFDQKVHQARGYTCLTGLSLWDTFRAANPLYTILAPSKVRDIINTMLAQYDEYGLLPVWPLCNSETNCMIGYHSVPVIVDAYLKGIRGFDIDQAYEAIKKSAMQDEFDINHFRKYNYIPRDLAPQISVARTLEYAFDDYCIAIMAKELGKTEDFNYFIRRAYSFKNLLDTRCGFMRGKDSKGLFREDFNPYNAVNANSDFIEGNSWQYTWFVPHAIKELVEEMGGKMVFVNKLDSLFTTRSELDKNTPTDVSGLIGQYAHGNEPSHHVSYLYNYGDEPWNTQEKVSQIMTTLYTNKPDGLCGNEDMGQMSAWYVFSALGFYPVNPVDGNYVFGTPLFREASVRITDIKSFVIKAINLSDKNIYIEKIILNGKKYNKGYLTHRQLMTGGTLEFYMRDSPGQVFTMP